MENNLNIKTADFMGNVIDTISDPIFVKNSNHSLILVNKAYCDFLGFTKEQVLGKSDYDFFPKEQVDVFWKKDDEVMETEKINVNEEKISNAQSEVREIVTTKSVYINPKGERFVVGVIRDVTEVKKINEINERHSREIEELNKAMLNREVEMSQIKKEIEICKKKLGIDVENNNE